MAIRFDAPGDYLSISADLPAYDPVSACVWLYLSNDRNATGAIIEFLNGAGTQYQGALLGSNGTTLNIVTHNGNTPGTDLTVGAWNHIGYTRSGATHKLYVNGLLDITRTDSVSIVPGFIVAGSNSISNVDGRLAGLKMWTGELSAEEMANESRTITPRRSANLYGFWPMFSGATERLRDYGGRGRNWVAGGTLTDEDGPPVSWGASPIIFHAALSAPPSSTNVYPDGGQTVQASGSPTISQVTVTVTPTGGSSVQRAGSPTVSQRFPRPNQPTGGRDCTTSWQPHRIQRRCCQRYPRGRGIGPEVR